MSFPTFPQEGQREGSEDCGDRVHFRTCAGGQLSGDTRAPGNEKSFKGRFLVFELNSLHEKWEVKQVAEGPGASAPDSKFHFSAGYVVGYHLLVMDCCGLA